MITEMIITIALFINALLVHELGHLYTATKYNASASTRYEKGDLVTYIPTTLSIQKTKLVYINGILAGFIALLPIYLYSNLFTCLALTIVYLWGCKFDFTMLRRLKRK